MLRLRLPLVDWRCCIAFVVVVGVVAFVLVLSESRPAPAELLVVHTDILSRLSAISLSVHPFCTNSNTKEEGGKSDRQTHTHTQRQNKKQTRERGVTKHNFLGD